MKYFFPLNDGVMVRDDLKKRHSHAFHVIAQFISICEKTVWLETFGKRFRNISIPLFYSSTSYKVF